MGNYVATLTGKILVNENLTIGDVILCQYIGHEKLNFLMMNF